MQYGSWYCYTMDNIVSAEEGDILVTLPNKGITFPNVKEMIVIYNGQTIKNSMLISNSGNANVYKYVNGEWIRFQTLEYDTGIIGNTTDESIMQAVFSEYYEAQNKLNEAKKAISNVKSELWNQYYHEYVTTHQVDIDAEVANEKSAVDSAQNVVTMYKNAYEKLYNMYGNGDIDMNTAFDQYRNGLTQKNGTLLSIIERFYFNNHSDLISCATVYSTTIDTLNEAQSAYDVAYEKAVEKYEQVEGNERTAYANEKISTAVSKWKINCKKWELKKEFNELSATYEDSYDGITLDHGYYDLGEYPVFPDNDHLELMIKWGQCNKTWFLKAVNHVQELSEEHGYEYIIYYDFDNVSTYKITGVYNSTYNIMVGDTSGAYTI